MLPESFIQELKYHCDVEQTISSYVSMNRRGRNLVGLCPFHAEKTASFTVYPESQSFYCFGCGAGGDVITFIMRAENLDYVEAVRLLAQRAGLVVPEDSVDDRLSKQKTRILELNRQAARFFYKTLISPEGAQALRYLRTRGLSNAVIKRFGLGWAPESWDSARKHLHTLGYTDEELQAADLAAAGRNGGFYDKFRGRVIFPIIDLRGNVIAFGGRTLSDKGPKYLNSSDTVVFKKSKNLFALNIAKSTKDDRLILAEGYMDVIAMHQAGFESAVATLGTALTQEQTLLLSRYCKQVVLAYDSDQAGQSATRRAIQLLGQTGLKVTVLSMEGAKDPDEYIQTFGTTRFKMLLDGSANAIEYEISKLKGRFDTSTADGKVSFLKEFVTLMAGLNNLIERDVYIAQTARELEVDKESVVLQVNASIKRRAREKAKRDKQIEPFDQPGRPRESDRERKEHLPFARAEERLIASLMKNPDYYDLVAKAISPEDFVTSYNREIFRVLCERLRTNRSVDLISLSGALSPDQMSYLSWLTASAAGISCSRQETEDYICKIRAHGEEKTSKEVAGMDEEDWKQYISSMAAKKNGGNRT